MKASEILVHVVIELRAEIPITSPPMPLGEYFARFTPPRVLPPGDQINYSNHGMALAGYIVEVK